ncbi:hypothetical protein FACS189434_04130 [Bacteroidia bacterium]|nr:hypothetical protein FACS189434_04130 [Bacteroidia bacterium]
MKRILLLLTVLLTVGSCDKFVQVKYFFEVWNNSSQEVYSYAEYGHLNSMLPIDKPKLDLIQPNYRVTYYDNHFNDPKFNRLRNRDTIIIFILDKTVVNTNEWGDIQENNMILKKYYKTEKPMENVYYYPADADL